MRGKAKQANVDCHKIQVSLCDITSDPSEEIIHWANVFVSLRTERMQLRNHTDTQPVKRSNW